MIIKRLLSCGKHDTYAGIILSDNSIEYFRSAFTHPAIHGQHPSIKSKNLTCLRMKRFLINTSVFEVSGDVGTEMSGSHFRFRLNIKQLTYVVKILASLSGRDML